MGGIQDASLILEQMQDFADGAFAKHPDPELAAKVHDAILDTRAAMIMLQRAGAGVESLSDERYLEALADFRATYEALTKLMDGLPGFSVSRDGDPTFRAGPGQLVVPEPHLISVASE